MHEAKYQGTLDIDIEDFEFEIDAWKELCADEERIKERLKTCSIFKMPSYYRELFKIRKQKEHIAMNHFDGFITAVNLHQERREIYGTRRRAVA